MKSKALRILCLLLAVCLLFTSCGGGAGNSNGGGGNDVPGGNDNTDVGGTDEKETWRVMLSYDTALVSVEGENPQEVEDGGTAEFKVTIAEGYLFKACSEGVYDQTTGILKVENVTERMNINFYVEEASNIDTDEFYVYIFNSAYEGDTTSVEEGSHVQAGTQITVRANDESRVFVGWTADATYSKGGRVLSTDREFTFRLTSEILSGGVLKLYSNYVTTNTIEYDANGGEINSSSANVSAMEYYIASPIDNTVVVTYKNEYLSFMECGSSFWDDGTFTREGYILKEYNTKADGSGESYSLGSKVPLINENGESMKLYCIWAQATAKEDFSCVDFSYPCPVDKKFAPDWIEDGVIITRYNGDDKEVVIPEKIDGKYVIAIKSGAFMNKDVETLVMGRRMQKIYDGSFIGCGSLSTFYFPDSIYDIGNGAFDSSTYKSFKHLYVNATMAPRYVGADNGALSVKLSRVLAPTDKPRIIIIAGSSSYQGLGTAYLEALLGGEYRVVNFGTTRTTHGLMYLEAMQHYADEDDVILYAPENSSYMLGEGELYWKTLRDLESMNNIFRYVDISGYSNIFGAFGDFNQNYRYKSACRAYEEICRNGSIADGAPYKNGTTDKYGDYHKSDRVGIGKYIDAYFVTMNEYVKSKDEGWWNDVNNQNANKDYTDPNNKTWANITLPSFADRVNGAVEKAKSSGAKVYFSYCPVDGSALINEARYSDWLADYDWMLDVTYSFDGRLGSAEDYIWSHEYFYDCAFHTNDYGRALRTYQLYTDLCEVLGIKNVKGMKSVGTNFEGCLFEDGDSLRYPWYPVE